MSVGAAKPALGGRLRLRTIDPIAYAVPAAVAVVLLLIVPLLLFFVYSFLTSQFYAVSGPLTLGNYSDALTSEITRRLAVNSAVVGLFTAAAAVAIGLPVAYWLRFRAGRLELPFLFLIVASMFAGYLVRIYAWRTILGQSGVLNSGLEKLGIIDQPLGFLVFNRFAVIVALLHIGLPYVILVLYASFRPLEQRHLDAAQDLGANAPVRWRRVVLPVMAAPAAAAFLFTLILTSADYVVPQFLGGTSDSMVGVQIQNYFLTAGNYALGAAQGLLTLVLYGLCFALVRLALRWKRLGDVRWA